MKLRDMLSDAQIRALEGVQDQLPTWRPREESDPQGVSLDALMALLKACLGCESRLPHRVRDQVVRFLLTFLAALTDEKPEGGGDDIDAVRPDPPPRASADRPRCGAMGSGGDGDTDV